MSKLVLRHTKIDFGHVYIPLL